MKTRIVFFSLLAAALCSSCSGPDGVVSTTGGKISGTQLESGVYAYLGVPYAEAEKFMPPHKASPWTGVRECTEAGAISRQDGSLGEFFPPQSDTCQFVNIWTSSLDRSAKHPVMFWIHGGGYASGSSMMFPYFSGESLALHNDITVVSVNHRLNITGYLDLSSYGEEYTGTSASGMLDVVAALQWVKDNIASFGGDPDNVTIFGESGGGGKVAALLCMPDAKGLFHKAIIESGTMPNIMDTPKSQRLGRSVIKHLFGSEEAFDKSALDAVPYEKLAAAGEEAIVETLGHRVPGSSFMWGFAPSLDGITLSEQPFVPGFAEYSKDIPLIIGTNLNEFSTMGRKGGRDTDENYMASVKSIYGNDSDRYIEAFKEAYPESTVLDWALIDRVMRPRTLSSAKSRAEQGAPAYVYLFTYESPETRGTGNSYHGLEQAFVFDNIELDPGCGKTDEDFAFEKIVTDTWANFARTGKPFAEGLPEWTVYQENSLGTMILDSKGCHMKYGFDEKLQGIIGEYIKMPNL